MLFFFFFHDLMTVTEYLKHLLSFLSMIFIVLFCLLSSQENLYMIHPDSDLFYEIHDTKNEHNQRLTYYFSAILNYFDTYF